MTTTDTKAPAAPITYAVQITPFDAMSLGSGRFGKYYRAEIIRSDGVTVWKGPGFSDPDTARRRSMANMTLGRLRRYYAAKGVCWHDVQQATRGHTKAGREMQAQLRGELHAAASAGLKAAIDGQPEDAIPYANDTAQGIIATQAYRLAKDRLADWADEHPEPVQP